MLISPVTFRSRHADEKPCINECPIWVIVWSVTSAATCSSSIGVSTQALPDSMLPVSMLSTAGPGLAAMESSGTQTNAAANMRNSSLFTAKAMTYPQLLWQVRGYALEHVESMTNSYALELRDALMAPL